MQIEDINQFQNYQTKLRRQQQQISKLEDQNNSLRSQLTKTINERNKFQRLLQTDPLYRLFDSIASIPPIENKEVFASYQNLQRRLDISLQQNLNNQRKVNILQRSLEQKQMLILKKQKMIADIQDKYYESIRQNGQIRFQAQKSTQQISVYQDIVKQYELKLKRMSQDFLQLKQNMLQRYHQQNNEIKTYAESLKQVSGNWVDISLKLSKQQLNINGQINEDPSICSYKDTLQRKFKQQQQIMQEMAQQLQLRNQQIANFISLDITKQQGQISKSPIIIKQMIRLNQTHQKKCQQFLSKHKQIITESDKNMNQKFQLQKKYQELKNKIESNRDQLNSLEALKRQCENYKNLSEKLQNDLKNCEENLIEILKENECFHFMMHDKYGPKIYLSKLNEECLMYQERFKERQTKQKWANITELIQMNQKLKRKLSLR